MKNTNKKILLMLKTPPPFGGGEIRGAALKDFVNNKDAFFVMELSSKKRNKSSQRKFELWKIKEFISHWFNLISTIRRIRPQLMFISLPKSFLSFVRDTVFVWTSLAYKVPCSGELAGRMFYFLETSWLGRIYGSFVLKKMRCVRVLGDSVAKDLAQFGIYNTIITDNGVNIPNDITYCAERKDGAVRILFAGTHSPQKGFDLLLRAFVELSKKNHRIELHTIGEWISNDFHHEMKSMITLNKIENRVVFNGISHGKEKWHIFSECQVLVLPSLMEGQPLVILEALGCGLPVIATTVGAVPETIADGTNGFLVEPGSADQLVTALEKIISAPALRRSMSQENIALFQKRFTLNKFLLSQVNWLGECAQNDFKPHGQRWKNI